MDPVKQLMDEHRVIERVVDVFDNLIEGLENGIIVSPELIMANIGMLVECANEYHCGKEVGIIVPYLDTMGRTDLKTALESYLNDYNNSFTSIDNILGVMEAYASGDMGAAAKIVENGLTFIKEVRPIFAEEDETVFKILKRDLDKKELAQLGEMIQDFEYSWNGPFLMNYQKMVREMERNAGQIKW